MGIYEQEMSHICPDTTQKMAALGSSCNEHQFSDMTPCPLQHQLLTQD